MWSTRNRIRVIAEDRNTARKAGFTLIEIMVVSGLSVIVIGMIIAALVMTERLQKAGTKQASLQRDSQMLQEKILRKIRAARSLVIKDSGDTAEFITDPNFTPFYSGDDLSSTLYLTATAASTPEGETIYNLVCDPDVSQAGDEKILSSRLVKDAAKALFEKQGGRLGINFSLKDDFAGDGFQSVDISTLVYGRNL